MFYKKRLEQRMSEIEKKYSDIASRYNDIINTFNTAVKAYFRVIENEIDFFGIEDEEISSKLREVKEKISRLETNQSHRET